MNIILMILIQLVTFIFIVLFLRWLLQANIARAVKRLQKLNQQNMQKEKVLKEEIERAKKDSHLEIEKGKAQAEQIKEEACQEIDRTKEDMLGKSKEEANRIIDVAVKEAERKQEKLLLEMQDRSVSIAADMVKYIFTDKNLENLHMQLIDELIQDIKNLDQKRFDTSESKAEIISAHALQDKQKEKLKTILSSKLGRDVSFTESLDHDMVAGLMIKMGGFVIDGSIKNKLNKIVPIMKDKFRARGD